MMEELDPAVDTTTEVLDTAPTMDDTMQATLEAIEAREEPAEEVGETAAQRARDAAGRFAKAEADALRPVADKPNDPKLQAAQQQPAEFQDKGPPQTWRPGAKALWANVPPELKAEVYKREADAMNGIQQYQARAEVGNHLMSVIAPYQPIMASLGATIPQALDEVLRAASVLHVGTPEQKATILRTLAQRHGVDLASPVNNGQDQFRDPVVESLKHELGQVKGQLAGFLQNSQNSERQAAEGEINAFHADPNNKYFTNVAAKMGQLINAGLASSMRDAYDKACNLDPEVRAAMQAEQGRAAEEDRARRAAAARRAGDLSVRSSPTPRPVSNPTKSWQDSMADTYNEILSRGAA